MKKVNKKINNTKTKNKNKQSNYTHMTFCLNRLHGYILQKKKKRTRKFNN